MSSNTLRKGKDYVKKDELIKSQEKAKDAVNVQTIDQWIEEVTRKHQILLELKEIEELIKDHDVSVTDPRLTPRWINQNPDVPLLDLGLRDHELSVFIEKYGAKLKCLNLAGQRINGDQLKKLLPFAPVLLK